MPIEYIPNQAAIFEQPIGSQPCLNNDTTAYNQLAQPGDTLCVQWKMLPCDEPLCEQDMYEQTGDQLLKSWQLGYGWSSNGGGDFLQFSIPASGGPALCQAFEFYTNTFTPGVVYRISFTIDYITGNYPLQLIVGLPTVFNSISITQVGSYDFYFIATSTDHSILWGWDTNLNDVNPTESCQISNISMLKVTEC